MDPKTFQKWNLKKLSKTWQRLAESQALLQWNGALMFSTEDGYHHKGGVAVDAPRRNQTQRYGDALAQLCGHCCTTHRGVPEVGQGCALQHPAGRAQNGVKKLSQRYRSCAVPPRFFVFVCFFLCFFYYHHFRERTGHLIPPSTARRLRAKVGATCVLRCRKLIFPRCSYP